MNPKLHTTALVSLTLSLFVSTHAFSEVKEAGAAAAHDYFNMLAARPEKVVAYGMRSQAELDKIKTGAPSERKQRVVYDAAMDAALFSIYTPISTDTQQKLLPIKFEGSSMLLTWDFRFDKYLA